MRRPPFRVRCSRQRTNRPSGCDGRRRGHDAGDIGRCGRSLCAGSRPGEVLVFSFVGFEDRKVTYSNQTTIDVELEPQSNSLDEVVVMGYSSQRKTELSSAVVSLDAEQLTDVTSPDIREHAPGQGRRRAGL